MDKSNSHNWDQAHLSKSKYNNLGLTLFLVKLAKEDIYCYVMIIISYLSLFQKLCWVLWNMQLEMVLYFA